MLVAILFLQLTMKNTVYLINNQRMFNLGIDDLAEKPSFHKNIYFYEFVANVLSDDIGTVFFDLRCHGGC